MATSRITRKALDAVVHEKMKRHRLSFDAALADTIQQFQLEGPSRMPSEQFEPEYRDRDRLHRDVPCELMSRSWEIDPRRDDMSRPAYSARGYRRDLSPGSVGDPLNLRSDNALAKERDEISILDARIRELQGLQDRSDIRSRAMDYSHNRNWDHERDLVCSPESNRASLKNYRELHSQSTPVKQFGEGVDFAGPVQDVLRSPGARGKMPRQQALRGNVKRGGQLQSEKAKDPANKHGEGEESVQEPGKPKDPIAPQSTEIPISLPEDNSPLGKCSLQIIRWAKFNSIDEDLEKERKELFKVSTEACKKIVECFKGPMTTAHKALCFSAVKFLRHPALKNPKIDNVLLDLLIKEKTVKTKNEFFEVIKPFDKEVMNIQQCLLKSAVPLLMACNTYELKHSFLTNERQLADALRNTVLLCRKSIVLLGQSFTMASSARQNNVLATLGLDAMQLMPSDYPNLKNSYLFGKDFFEQVTAWLKKTGVKPVIKYRFLPAEKVEDYKVRTKIDSKEQEASDPTAVATIDQLLGSAMKGDQTEGEKPPFWFLFEVNSNEYKYYRHKLANYQKSIGRTSERTTQTKKLKIIPKVQTSESVRSMIYLRAALGVKRRISRSLAYSRKQKKLRSQAPPSSSCIVKIKPEESATGAEMVKTVETPEPPPSVSTAEPQMSTAVCPPETSESVKCTPPSEPDYSDVDDKTKDTAIKLAEFVAQMGPEIEQFSMENSTNNPELWFLHDKSSSAYSFYQSKVREFQQAAQDSPEVEFDNDDLENIQAGDAQPLEELDTTEMAAESEADVSISPECPLTAAFTQMPTPVEPSMPRKRVAKLKVGMLPAKRVCLVNEPNVHDPVRIEYERPRGHVFNRKTKPVDLEFANKKLTQQNKGFQMLNKMGWRESQGLGSSGSGITKLVKVESGQDLGVKEREAAKSTEDNLDVFRHRMMETYKYTGTKS